MSIHSTGSSDDLRIDTPEQITFDYDIADVGTRFMAIFIDSLIQYSIMFVLILGVAGPGRRMFESFGNEWQTALILLFVFVIQFGYFIVFELLWNGQTPGKLAIKLRVIREDGRPLSPVDVLVRNLVRVIDFFPVAYSIGLITMVLNKRAKRLGDLAAGTLVVRVRAQVALSDLDKSLERAVLRNESGGTLSLPSIRNLSESDIQLIESFLERQNQMSNSSALAERLAGQMMAKMASTEADALLASMPNPARLRRIVAAYRE